MFPFIWTKIWINFLHLGYYFIIFQYHKYYLFLMLNLSTSRTYKVSNKIWHQLFLEFRDFYTRRLWCMRWEINSNVTYLRKIVNKSLYTTKTLLHITQTRLIWKNIRREPAIWSSVSFCASKLDNSNRMFCFHVEIVTPVSMKFGME